MNKNKLVKTIEQANEERFIYYRAKDGVYNYGILEGGIFSIFRRSDGKLLHKFNTADFKPIIKPVLTGRSY